MLGKIVKQQRLISHVTRTKTASQTPTRTQKGGSNSTLGIPEWGHYASRKPQQNQVFSYFMAGTLGMLTAVGAKATVQGETMLNPDVSRC